MKDRLSSKISEALQQLDYPDLKVIIQTPKNPEFGDFATNIAMMLAPKLKCSPLKIAESITQKMRESDSDAFMQNITIAKPGFINFKLNKNIYTDSLIDVLNKSQNFGKSKTGNGQNVLVEFVSANPTGPINIGHTRNAIWGDTVSTILEWNGYHVQREYYFNDSGQQMTKLGKSVYARYLEKLSVTSTFPEDGYVGDYIKDIATAIENKYQDSLKDQPDSEIFKSTAEKFIFNDIQKSLARLGIKFDTFFNEKELYEDNSINNLLEELKSRALIYEKDDAIWLKGAGVGREMDKVLIKKTGEPTYRLPDMAYHINKFKRGYDLMIDVFGTDHIEEYPDIIAVLKTLDYDVAKLKVLIYQFVTIVKNGVLVKMSTRKANFVTLDDLIDEVGTDVVRYFFLMRSMNTHLNFDLNLAKNQSDENPVYYLQYAHARVCNILKRAKSQGYQLITKTDLSPIKSDIELRLIRKLADFPELIKKTLDTLEPQNIANYLQELATNFHKFYAHERVLSDDKALTAARLILIQAVKIVLNNGLTILGITAPERM